MTHTDQSRAEFDKWRIQDRRDRIPDMVSWTDEQIANLLLDAPEREWDIWQAARATTEQSSGVELPEPVTWLVERHAFSVSPHGQDAEGHSWIEEAHEPGEQGSFAVYTDQQVRALLAVTEKSSVADLPRAGAEALTEYLRECDDHAIVPDVGGAFAHAFRSGAMLAGVKDSLTVAPAVPEGWIPIEGDLPEGSWLVYMPWERQKFQAAYVRKQFSQIGSAFGFDLTPPSHYMPLPQPPKEQT